MSSTSNPTHPQANVAIESTLKKTELGLSILHHRNFYISTIGGALLLALAFGGYQHYQKTKNEEASAAFYDFKQNYLFEKKVVDEKEKDNEGAPSEEMVPKEINASTLEEFSKLSEKYSSQALVIPIALNLAQRVEGPELVQKLLPSLEKVYHSHHRAPILGVYLSLAMASLQEDVGNLDGAIKTMETLANSPDKSLVEDKIYLDLGRLYRQKGDVAKAKAQWEHLLKNFPNSQWLRMAKLLMGKDNP